MSALEVKERELVYTVDPEAWGALPHDYASIAAWNIGLKDQAIFHSKQAVSLNPDDERLQKNLILVQERRSGGRMHRLRQSGTESASVVADRALGRGTS
jgi:hypothetical protein